MQVGCRTFNDLRLCMMFQLIPCVAIPAMTFLYPPKYTHSRYWLWAAGVCLLAKFEDALDKKIYNANRYLISGHSLEHLCSAAIPVLFAIMLIHRTIRCQRLGDLKERPRPWRKWSEDFHFWCCCQQVPKQTSVGRTLKCRNRSTWNLFPDVIFNVQDISSFWVLTHFYRPSIPTFNLQFAWQNAVEIKFISPTMPPCINLILFFDMNCTPPPSSIFIGESLVT